LPAWIDLAVNIAARIGLDKLDDLVGAKIARIAIREERGRS
jgi:hypothetical protein